MLNSLIKSDRVSDKEKGNVVNRHTEQPRRFNTSSKSKRGYHSNDNGKEGKKAKMQYHGSSSTNKGNESENSVKKTATDIDFRGKKEKQRVDRNIGVDIQHAVESISVERTIDPNHKRKQQREAVDALLPSGFISSNKKPESSLKSVPNGRTVHRSGQAIKHTTSRKG